MTCRTCPNSVFRKDVYAVTELWLIFLFRFSALDSLVLLFKAERSGGSDGGEEPEEELRRETERKVLALNSGILKVQSNT